MIVIGIRSIDVASDEGSISSAYQLASWEQIGASMILSYPRFIVYLMATNMSYRLSVYYTSAQTLASDHEEHK